MSGQSEQYVVGFLFSEDGDNCLLIEKRRPKWQAGFLNGIGGKIEPGESPDTAMRREGIEEAGVDPEWSPFVVIRYPDMVLHFFAARDQAAYRDARPGTDEYLVRIYYRGGYLTHGALPNLHWLLPLARHHLFYEKVAEGLIVSAGYGGMISRKQ